MRSVLFDSFIEEYASTLIEEYGPELFTDTFSFFIS
jgi:hypothetical protein